MHSFYHSRLLRGKAAFHWPTFYRGPLLKLCSTEEQLLLQSIQVSRSKRLFQSSMFYPCGLQTRTFLCLVFSWGRPFLWHRVPDQHHSTWPNTEPRSTPKLSFLSVISPFNLNKQGHFQNIPLGMKSFFPIYNEGFQWILKMIFKFLTCWLRSTRADNLCPHLCSTIIFSPLPIIYSFIGSWTLPPFLLLTEDTSSL